MRSVVLTDDRRLPSRTNAILQKFANFINLNVEEQQELL